MNKQIINPEDYFLASRHDFATFVGMAFSTLWPNKPYLQNWHIEAMASQLMKTHTGDCTRLIVNMPPRMLKSIVMSVAWPAWVLGHDTSAEIMCISYGDELVKDLGNLTLALMQSERYQKVFPNVRLYKRRPPSGDIRIIGGGRRLGQSVGAQITGRGANIIIIDDPLKASDARTKQRDIVNAWFDENIYQRLNHKNTGVIILVMQRLHNFDLTGYLLEKQGEWKHLCLPAIAEKDEEYELIDGDVYSRKCGEILHPAHESADMLEMVKINNGSYNFAAQYQQAPESDKEALIQRGWFKIEPPETFPKLSEFKTLYMSWDTANNVGESNDYSVGILLGYKDGEYYVLDVIRKKLKFPDLLKLIEERLFVKGKHVYTIVEDAGSGNAIIEALRSKKHSIHAFKAGDNKFTRLCSVSGLIESGLVHLPAGAHWLDEFLLEITRFPNAVHDDQVDAFTQAVLFSKNQKKGFDPIAIRKALDELRSMPPTRPYYMQPRPPYY